VHKMIRDLIDRQHEKLQAIIDAEIERALKNYLDRMPTHDEIREHGKVLTFANRPGVKVFCWDETHLLEIHDPEPPSFVYKPSTDSNFFRVEFNFRRLYEDSLVMST